MIAAIIDLVASRETSARERRSLDTKIRSILDQLYKRFKEFCNAVPALTQGDTIEVLMSSWQPVVFLFHRLLMEGLEFRVGLGTGEIIVYNEIADECDGPAFWNAREALEEAKQTKYKTRTGGFRLDKKNSPEEESTVMYTLLFLTTLLGLTQTQLLHCYYFLWEKKRIFEIGNITKTSAANISKSLNKTPCYLLEEVLSYLDRKHKRS